MPKLSPEDHLKFAAQVLETKIFGAFWLAIEARRKERGLNQTQIAERMGRDKTNISKLLEGPRNWTTRTMSDLAETLGLRVDVNLEDKETPGRKFTPTGVVYAADVMVVAQMSGFGPALENVVTLGPSASDMVVVGPSYWSMQPLAPGLPINGTFNQISLTNPVPVRRDYSIPLAG